MFCKHCTWKTILNSYTFFNAANNLYALGVYADSLPSNNAKPIGDVPTKLDAVLNLAENTDLIDIDITIDGGLSTIYAVTNTLYGGASAGFDDTIITDTLTTQVNALTASTGNPVSNTLTAGWNAITSR